MAETSDTADVRSNRDSAILEESSNDRFQAGAYQDAVALQKQALLLHVDRSSLCDQARCHQTIGYLCLLLRDYPGAEQAYRQAIRLKEGLDDHRGAAASWGRLAEVHQHVGDHQTALQAFEQSLSFLRRCGALKDLGVVLNNMAVSHREIGQRDQAIQCHERALEIRRDLGDHEGLAASLHNVGVLHADIGNYDSARKVLEEAHQLREDLGHMPSLASTKLRIGILREQQGEHAEALACYERVISLCEGLPDCTEDLAAALCNMGGLLTGRGEPARAMPFLERARTLLEASVETPRLSYVEFNLGLAKIAQGNVQEGLVALSTAQRIQQRCGDIRHLGATLSAMAVVEAQRGEFAGTETLLHQALEIQERLGEHDAKIHTLRLLGYCKKEQGHAEAAQRYLTEAENLSLLIHLRTSSGDAVDVRNARAPAATTASSRVGKIR